MKPPGFEPGQVRGGLQVILTAEHYIHSATRAARKTHKIVFLQKPLPVAGLPLLKTQENHLGWESVHLDPNEPGAMGYLGTLEHFALEHVATVNISFDEDYYPK